jgi:hypothetical protein
MNGEEALVVVCLWGVGVLGAIILGVFTDI